jgi:hypothetical protein
LGTPITMPCLHKTNADLIVSIRNAEDINL